MKQLPVEFTARMEQLLGSSRNQSYAAAKMKNEVLKSHPQDDGKLLVQMLVQIAHLYPPPPSLMWSSAEQGSQEKAAKSLGLPSGQKDKSGSCLQHFDSSENP